MDEAMLKRIARSLGRPSLTTEEFAELDVKAVQAERIAVLRAAKLAKLKKLKGVKNG